MKGLALCCVLLGGLGMVLVFAATKGLGARTPSFSSDNSIQIQTRTQAIQTNPAYQAPDVELTSSDDLGTALTAIPAPEVRISRKERKRVAPIPKPSATIVLQTPAGPELPPKEIAKPVVKAKPAPEVKEPPREPEPEKLEEPVFKPRDVTDAGPNAQLEADREWRKQTLERWQREEQQKRDGAKTTTIMHIRPGQEPELKGTPAEGLFRADKVKESAKKKKKKRHFLFIKW